MALMASAPAFAQPAATRRRLPTPPLPPPPRPLPRPLPAAAGRRRLDAPTLKKGAGQADRRTACSLDAKTVVKVVMIGLLLASVFSWTLLITEALRVPRP